MSGFDAPNAVRCEVARTARLLRVEPSELSYLLRFDPLEVRSVRLAVHARLRSDNAHRFARLAKLSGLLPRGMVATLAQRTMSPRLAAGVVEALQPEHAAELAVRMEASYLARTCEYLPPDVATPVITRLPDATLLTVCDVLAERSAYEAMAEMLESLTDDRLRTFMEHVDDPAALLGIGAAVTADGQLERLATLAPDTLLSRVVRYAVDSPPHWELTLSLLTRLPGQQRRRLMATVPASGDPD